MPQNDPGNLSELMSLESSSRQAWGPDELGAVLRHQLSASLRTGLSQGDSNAAWRLTELLGAGGSSVETFNDLLHHPQPPIELLEMAKDFAKASRTDRESPLPREVAAVLYYASIVAALVHCRCRITTLDDALLSHGLRTALSHHWLDEATRSLLREGLETLGNGLG